MPETGWQRRSARSADVASCWPATAAPSTPTSAGPFGGSRWSRWRGTSRAEAERLALRAVALCTEAGAEYIRARAETVLAQVWIAAGRFEDASDQLDRSGASFFGTVGLQHIRIAERQAVLGELHLGLRELGPAEEITSRCEAMRRGLLHEDHAAILEARLLRQRVQIGLGNLEPAGSELLAIGEAAERLLGADHPLAIQVASARLECATAGDDAAATEALSVRLASLRERRAKRLRGDGKP